MEGSRVAAVFTSGNRRHADVRRAHPSRHGNGVSSLYVAGTGLGASARPPVRHFFLRRDAARDGNGASPLRRQFIGRTDFVDLARRSAIHRGCAPGVAFRPCRRHPPLPREGPSPPGANRARREQPVPRPGATDVSEGGSGKDTNYASCGSRPTPALPARTKDSGLQYCHSGTAAETLM